jgi:hypothetical protein
LTDNAGQPIAAEILLELQRDLLSHFGGFTIHPTSQGKWQSRGGRVYQEEVVVYEVAVPEESVPHLRQMVTNLGWRLGQLAMYFDAPPPSVDIIDLSGPPRTKEDTDESGKGKAARRRRKKNRPEG